jgi:hypothetical protein
MTKAAVTESVVERAALAWFESVGWLIRNGADIALGEPTAERDDYSLVVPDKQKNTTQTVLEQAELLSRDWAVA